MQFGRKSSLWMQTARDLALTLLSLSIIICKLKTDCMYLRNVEWLNEMMSIICHVLTITVELLWDFPGSTSGKEPACQFRRLNFFFFFWHGFDPLVEKIPGGGHGRPLQYSCLKNPMDRGAWWAAVHKVTTIRSQRVHDWSDLGRTCNCYILYYCCCCC